MLGISGFVFPSCLGFSGFGLSPAFISPGGSEFLLVMLVLILLFGAKDAPRIFRSIHNALDKMQRAAASFRYKIMYGDLYQDTTHEEPYDVEADYGEQESGEQESGGGEQETEPEAPDTRHPATPTSNDKGGSTPDTSS